MKNKKIVLGIPVVNQVSQTEDCLYYLLKTKTPDLKITLIDNASDVTFIYPDVNIIRNKKNLGYYYPLKQLYDNCGDAEYVGLMHNDLYIYDEKWVNKIIAEFEKDERLAAIGIAGTSEVDVFGGRGGGLMCNFRGLRGQSQNIGEKITDLRPAVLIDGIFIVFRSSVVPLLNITEDVPLFNFVDRGWCLELIKNGWKIGVLGIESDHIGGVTEYGESKYVDDAKLWLKENNLYIKNQSPTTTMFNVAEQMYLEEYKNKKGLIPLRIDRDWNLIK